MSVDTQQLVLRTASAADVAALAALEASYYPTDGYPEPLFFQAVNQWPELFQIACIDDLPVAYCMGAPAMAAKSIWLMSLLVSSEQRGQGIGAKLLQHWLTAADQLDYHSHQLSVAPDNKPAIQLYRQFGFRHNGLKSDYLGPGLHRLLMIRQSLTSR